MSSNNIPPSSQQQQQQPPGPYASHNNNTNNNMSNNLSSASTYTSMDDDKGRGSYKCGRCGVPKKGHICPYQPKVKRRPGDPMPEMKCISTQVEMDEVCGILILSFCFLIIHTHLHLFLSILCKI
jgi:hypothetical protein